MDIYYELLDQASGTQLKGYDSETEAWDDLQAFSHIHGIESLAGLALLRVTNDVPKLVAMNDDLIEHVQRRQAIRSVQQRTSGAVSHKYHVRFLMNTPDATNLQSSSSTTSFHGIAVNVA